jgi:glycosyltransferase involved in cell wall biosynthesis
MDRSPILLLTQSLALGGSERQLTEIAKALDRSRFEPHVGCFRSEGFRAQELLSAGVPVAQFPVASFLGPSALSGALSMGRYFRKHSIRLVHTFDVPLNLFGIPVAKLFRVPYVISSQRALRALTPGLRRHMLRLTDRLADAVVVNSLAVARELMDVERVPRNQVQLCYNGIDTGLFHPRPRPCEGSLIIGVICAFRPEKGLETLLEAFARMAQQRSDLRLLLIGDGPSLPALRSLAGRLTLGERCTFESPVKDVAAWLGKINIFVLPSLSESFSNSLMEAMACGCCAVASRVGGNLELIADRENGLLFHAGDVEDLSHALEMLVRDSALRARLSAAGSERIRKEFSLERSAKRMAEIYSEVMKG